MPEGDKQHMPEEGTPGPDTPVAAAPDLPGTDPRPVTGTTFVHPMSDTAAGRSVLRRAASFLRRRAVGVGTSGLEGLRGAGTAARLRATGRLQAAALTRPGLFLRPLGAARRLWPKRLDLAQAEALLTARARGWAAAAPLFARIGDPGGPVLAGQTAAGLLRPGSPATAGPLAIPASDRPGSLPPTRARDIVVVTAVVGAAQPLLPVFGAPEGLRLVCFTDQPLAAAPGWQGLPPPPLPAEAAADAGLLPDPTGPKAEDATSTAWAAWLKIRTPEALDAAGIEAEASLWVDPDCWLLGNLDTLFTRWLLGQELVLWRHPASDWRDMAERHLLAGALPAQGILAQAGRLAMDKIPGGRGACDTGMVWRRHNAPGLPALTEAWWQAWAAAPGPDDLALYRALNDPAAPLDPDVPGERPAILPGRLGAAADNIFTVRTRRQPVRTPQAQAPALPAPAPPVGGHAISGRPLPIVFLSAPAHANSASTLLRGHQLSHLVASAFPERFAVSFTEDEANVRDAVVLLTKGAMAMLAPDQILALRKRNRAAIGAWDDIRPDPRKARLVDATMTLSHRQTIELNRLYPQAPSFLVTHHVNTQVQAKARAMTPPEDRLRTGYFGDLENTVRPPALASLVELVGIDTRNVEKGSSWVDTLPQFNCHWIVRRARPWDGWKPFLKGFVAAHCRSAVITTADDGDAPYYLGDDYPFYAESLDASDLEMALLRAAGSFGGPDWRLALEIMGEVAARSTDAQVAEEFRLMIDEVTG